MIHPARRAFIKRCWTRLCDRSADLRWEIHHANAQCVDINDPGFDWREDKAKRLNRAADRLARQLRATNPQRKD